MKKISSLTLLLVLFPLTASAQNLYTKKDLAFAQVAAGGGYETWLNITNRGPDTYTGVLNLFQSGQAQAGLPWSPLVNGTQIVGGRLNIVLNSGASATFQITQAGGTQAGYAVIVADNLDMRSFLEGTLTYYVSSGGVLVDSVGVQPCNGFYITAIPFDDFFPLAMALANFNATAVTAKLSVFSDTNARVGTLDQPLSSLEHKAVYLRQLFPSLQLTKGRLEIQSNLPILGTILTDIDGQLSSLPMLPAVKAYNFTGTLAGLTYSGEISLWFDGQFAQGFLRALTVGGVPEQNVDTITVTGSLIDGALQVITTGSATSDNQILTYLLVNPYSLTQATQQGTATGWFLPSHILAGTGTLTLSAIN